MASVQYHGGPLLAQIEVVSIYLNIIIDSVPTGDWHQLTVQGSDRFLFDHLDDFLDDITNSEYTDTLTEYNATGTNGIYYNITKGKKIGSYLLTSGPFKQYSTIGYSPDSTEIATFTANNWAHIVPWLSKAIQNRALPSPHSNLCYFVFTPPGVSLGGASGAHYSFPLEDPEHSTSTVHYAVIAHPNSLQPQNVQTTTDQFNQLTITTSHEFVEAITDPESHTGWSSIQSAAVKFEGEEIADLCATRSFSLAGYQVSSFWSETQQQCVGCQIRIRLQNSVGGDEVIEGQIAHLSAEVPCLANEHLAYHWTVSGGATPTSDDAQPSFFIRMPSSPNTVTVAVTVTTSNAREAQISTVATYQSIRGSTN